MDVGALSTGLATSAVGQQVDVGVLKTLQNLDKNLAAELFASIGLGQAVDTRA
jgi:uncharacterized PurR-regulated membrane protein YhhQ (DUF165 family)